MSLKVKLNEIIKERPYSWKLPRKFLCPNCKTEFPNRYGKISKFCSRLCRYQSQKGQHPHNFGKKNPPNSGENHYAWKGDKVGYYSLHNWIKRKLGKPYKCENSKCVYPRLGGNNKIMIKPKRYDWSNISGKYKRDLSDWRMLCVSCHKINDLYAKRRFKTKIK